MFLSLVQEEIKVIKVTLAKRVIEDHREIRDLKVTKETLDLKV